MNRTRTAAIMVAAALGVVLGGYGIVAAQSSDTTPETEPSTGIQAPEGSEDTEDDAVDPARAAEATITATDAKAAAIDAAGGGTASDAVLEDGDGSLVFEVDVVDAAGSSVEVKVDAITGKATVEADEAEDDDDDADSDEADDDDAQHENEHEGDDDPDEDHDD